MTSGPGAAPAGPTARPVVRALLALALASAAVSVFVAVSGGGRLDVAGWRLSVRSPWPAALLAVACAFMSWTLARRGPWPPPAMSEPGALRLATGAAAGVAAATALVGLLHGSAVPSGADASGYLSQARLWRAGALTVPQPAIAEAPWPSAAWTYSPLGFRPGVQPGTIVPTYPPGLALHFALAGSLGGHTGERLVLPVLGAVGVWAAFLLGRRLSGATGGVAAAVLLASSPVWLNQLLQPMSDVPVTAWWLVSVAVAAGGARPTSARAALAGLAAGVALLVRPNLVLLLPVPAVLLLAPRGGDRAAAVRTLAAYGAGVAPALAGLAAFNAALYGAPWASGYGSARELFDAAFVATNARLYGGWLLDVHTPLLAAAIAGAVALAAGPRPAGAIRLALALSALSALVLISYLPYAPFESWTYLRFLLPALAALAVVAGVAMERLARPGPTAAAVALLALTALAAASWDTARDGGVFATAQRERRYALVAEWVRQHAPGGAHLLAAQHSGSLFAATGRPVIRWDLLDAGPGALSSEPPGTASTPASSGAGRAWLDLAWTARHRQAAAGDVAAWLVVDADEEPAFRRRFASVSELGRLDWPPSAATDPPDAVRIYRLDDRARYLAGSPVRTERITAPPPR